MESDRNPIFRRGNVYVDFHAFVFIPATFFATCFAGEILSRIFNEMHRVSPQWESGTKQYVYRELHDSKGHFNVPFDYIKQRTVFVSPCFALRIFIF